jgi:hypothetical protein
MTRNRRWRFWALVFTLVSCSGVAWGEARTWSNKSGQFKITADLVAVQRGNVVLRTTDGRQLTVSVKQLSDEDQAYIEGLSGASNERRKVASSKGNELATLAESFFAELRSEKRQAAGEMLTAKAQEVLKGGKSPLATLPAPEEGDRAIHTGRPKVEKEIAEIPVKVKSANKIHKVKLHFRKQDDEWRVFGMSAMYPEGERLINLESDVPAEGEAGSLEALVGKPFQFSGMTLDGKPLNLAPYQGKVVLVAFWISATRGEMANVFASYRKHFNEGFDVISVSMDDDIITLADQVSRERPPWAVIADKFPGNPQQMGQKYQISKLPALILVGRDGKVAAVDCTGKKLEEELAKLLATKQDQPNASQPNANGGDSAEMPAATPVR